MEEKNKAALPVTQEEFEAMRRRYAGELMAIRRSVDAILDQNGLLPREEREAPVRYNCQGVQVENDGGLQETDDPGEYNAQNGVLSPDTVEELTPSDAVSAPLNDTGTIQVTVSTAQDAVPIEGAVVLISREEEEGKPVLLQAMITDTSGKTPILTVPAPSRELTEAPGERVPFAVYRAAVTAPGFLPMINENITVFGGSESLYTAALLPKPQPQVPRPNSDAADGSLFF